MSSLYGLLGQSLKHSISQKLHQAIFNKMGISSRYHLFEVERSSLQNTLNELEAMGVLGINVTIPYKVEVVQYLDKLSPEAEKIGAVNCVAFNNHESVGYNTDYFGFGMLLEKNDINTFNMKATVLGCGGAAKTVIRFLLDHGVDSIVVASRNMETCTHVAAEEASRKIKLVDYKELLLHTARDIVINCTPCGMYPNVHESPVVSSTFKNYHTAVDIIYNPVETMFLRHAKEAGLKAVNGLYMLVGQAVAAQEIWNGVLLNQSDIEYIYQFAGCLLPE